MNPLNALFAWWNVTTQASSSLGQRGEAVAEKFLRKLGYRILARNYRNKLGEIDLIAIDGHTVVFVEVKTRTDHRAGCPTEAVTADKQRQLTKVALSYLKRYRLLEHAARFDVVAITWTEPAETPAVTHLQHAFPAIGLRQMFS